VITDRAHHSNQQVPTLDTNWGTGMLIVNIFLPGVGTLVAGIKSERNTTMVIGVFQFLLAFIIVGWIWSIYWGYLLYKKVRAPCWLASPPRLIAARPPWCADSCFLVLQAQEGHIPLPQ
jgi:hypothetical protein